MNLYFMWGETQQIRKSRWGRGWKGMVPLNCFKSYSGNIHIFNFMYRVRNYFEFLHSFNYFRSFSCIRNS